MKLREYGVITTGVLGAVFSFDLIWNLTKMEAFDAMFTAMIIGISAAFAFVLITEPRPAKKTDPVYEFQTDNTGLEVLVRRRR